MKHEEIENLNRSVLCKELQSIIKKPTNKGKTQDQIVSLVKFYQTFKESTLFSLKLFQKIKEWGKLPNLLYEASKTLIPKPDKDNYKKRKGTGQYS